MPSVLIETGFLTNPSEEQFLGSKDGQIQMANSIFKAFKKYKNKLEGISDEVTNDKVESKSPEPEKKTGNTPKEKVPDEKNNTTSSVENETETKGKVIFKIQFDMSDKQLPLNASRFKGLKTDEYMHDGAYKYVTGNFINDFNGANTYKNEVRKLGFSTAFVVAFLDGERINLEKGIKLAQN
jgi:N-acetylmuramoyl-L-alanine amidase